MRMGPLVDTYQRQVQLKFITELLKGRVAPDRFPAATCSSRIPTGTVALFPNGNMQIVGTHAVIDALLVGYLVTRRVMKHFHIIPQLHSFCVCNIVSSASLGYAIDLPKLAKDMPTHCVYNPESFEGCRFNRSTDPLNEKNCVTFVLFSTGRCVITGGRSRDKHIQELRVILPILRQYAIREPIAKKRTLATTETHTTTRYWLCDKTQKYAWFSAARGIDGCTHPDWVYTSKHPQCKVCQRIATPYQFPLTITECEHLTSWTTTPVKVCDECGNTSVDDYNYFCTQKQKERAHATITHVSRKRFKPFVDENTVMGVQLPRIKDPRKQAESRFNQVEQ